MLRLFSSVLVILVCPFFGMEDLSSPQNDTQLETSDVSSNGTDTKKVEALEDGDEVDQGTETDVFPRVPPIDVLRTCDVTFYDRNFVLTSPGYPNPYADNLDCVAVVRQSSEDVCSLRLTFLFFSLQYSPGCHLDSLNVNEDDRLCGTLPPGTTREYSFAGFDIRLRFRSDAFESSGGFFLKAKQISCGENGDADGTGCGAIIDAEQFDLTNSNWPLNEGNVMDCTFTVRKMNSDVCSLQLIFVGLQLDCRFEFLQIGPRRFCSLPKNQFQIVDFNGPNFLIRFHSDFTNKHSRYLVKITQRPCNFALTPVKPETAGIPPQSSSLPLPFPPPKSTEVDQKFCILASTGDGAIPGGLATSFLSSFLIRSSGFPTFYDNGLDCTFIVRKASPNICSLFLLIQDFDVEFSPDCDHDFLDVGGQRLCGVLPQGSLRIFDFPNDEIQIRFVSDAERTGRGFGAALSQRECGVPSIKSISKPPYVDPGLSSNCDGIYTTRSFVIRSSDSDTPFTTCTFTVYNLNYPNDCTTLTLDFRLFNFGSGVPDCSDSFLEVKGDRLCGQFIEGTTRAYSFDGPSFRIVYRSGLNRPNFYVLAQQETCKGESAIPRRPIDYPVQCSDIGSVTVFRPSDLSFRLFFATDRFWPPLVGPFLLDCVHVIAKSSPQICQMRLDFKYLGENDFIELNGRIRVYGSEVSGAARNIDFLGPQVYIRVRVSNSRLVDIQGTQLTCYEPRPPAPSPDPASFSQCNQTFQLGELTLQPSLRCQLGSFFQCAYTIAKINADICNLDVEFIDFNLQNSQLCAVEFLDVAGSRFCSSIPRGITKRFEFPGNFLQITYSTCSCGERFPDFQRGGDGTGGSFTVLVRQIPCLILPVHMTARRNQPRSIKNSIVT